jgi:hypothetical protein
VGLERVALSLVSTIEELLERKSSGSGEENREYGSRNPSHWPSGTFYLKILDLTSPTNGGHSVGIVRSRTQATELVLFVLIPLVHDTKIKHHQYRSPTMETGSSTYLSLRSSKQTVHKYPHGKATVLHILVFSILASCFAYPRFEHGTDAQKHVLEMWIYSISIRGRRTRCGPPAWL